MLVPGEQVDHYEIVALIGEGTFGFVYRAKDKQLERDVALKLLKPSFVLMEEFMNRFLREARTLAQFQHPNIVHIYRLGQWRDTWYLEMEYVPRSLGQVIGEGGGNASEGSDGGTVPASSGTPLSQTLPLDDALNIIDQICTGLDEAHSRGVIHRDIKPENILLTENGQVKVCDFGIARVTDGTGFNTVGPLGTREYSAPEQMYPERFADHTLNTRADVYAVCAVLYRLLSGVVPGPAGNPAPLSQFAPDVPTELVEVIMKGLAWAPSDRFVDLMSLQGALRNPPNVVGADVQITPRKTIPEDLREMWEAHAVRLKGMGFDVPGDQELVIRNEKDDGIALWIPPGEFMMGNEDGRDNEKPVHRVELDGFYMDMHLITVGQYQKYVKEKGVGMPERSCQWQADHPMVWVSWEDAQGYCDWSGKVLPSEAQWEYGARGVDGRKYAWGNEEPSPELCNYKMNVGKTTPVDAYPSGISAFGLYDMSGNVWEWCLDWYDVEYYGKSPVKNPVNDKLSDCKIIRGGSWSHYLSCCAHRERDDLDVWGSSYVGFRCVRQK